MASKREIRFRDSGQPHFAPDDFDRNRSEGISSRRTGETPSGLDVETCAMRRANDLARLEKKSARRPVQPAAGMWTLVEISEHVRTLAQQDHRKYPVVELGIDSSRSAIGNGVELA